MPDSFNKLRTFTPMYRNFTNPSGKPKLGDKCYADVYTVICVLNIVCSLTASLGNFLVLGAVWKTRILHKPTNLLVSGLAVSDLGVGVLIQPLFTLFLILEMRSEGSIRDMWKIFRSIQAVFQSATVLILTSISVDRFLALQLHLKYVSMITINKTATLLCFIWVTSAFCAMTVFIGNNLYRNFIITLILLCLVINSSMHFMIYRICHRHRVQIQVQIRAQNGLETLNIKRYRKSLITMIFLFILLMACYFPYICMRAAMNFIHWSSPFKRFVMRCTLFLVYLNSSLNPLVYCWRMREMRSAVKQFWKSLHPWECFKSIAVAAAGRINFKKWQWKIEIKLDE